MSNDAIKNYNCSFASEQEFIAPLCLLIKPSISINALPSLNNIEDPSPNLFKMVQNNYSPIYNNSSTQKHTNQVFNFQERRDSITSFLNEFGSEQKQDQKKNNWFKDITNKNINMALPKSKKSKIKRRKNPKGTCNCTKSNCLKLYCECFSSGKGCSPTCRCQNCLNNEEHKDLVDKVINETTIKNPLAFKNKIKEVNNDEGIKIHSRGCNCKKTNCSKNYCECFREGIQCTPLCQCTGCNNCSDNAKEKEKFLPHHEKIHRKRKKIYKNTDQLIHEYMVSKRANETSF